MHQISNIQYHLLHGKSHKKESQIVSLASKLGFIGLVVYGTPGVIGLLSTCHTDDDSNGGWWYDVKSRPIYAQPSIHHNLKLTRYQEARHQSIVLLHQE